MRPRTAAIVAGPLLAGALLAGCSSSGNQPAAGQPPAGGQVSTGGQVSSGGQPSATPTQWWSAEDYCGILQQTVAAGRSILPGATAGDPKLLTATKNFVSAVTDAAPNGIRHQWEVLGPALIDLVESGGKGSAMSGVNTRLVAQSAAAIAADAKTRCDLDLSS